jgi:hypothetical protein
MKMVVGLVLVFYLFIFNNMICAKMLHELYDKVMAVDYIIVKKAIYFMIKLW